MLLILIAISLLCIVPGLGNIARIPFAIAGLLLFLYSLLLYVSSLMGVQSLSVQKSLLCLVSVLVVVLLLVIFVNMLFESSDMSNNHGGGDRNSDRNLKSKRNGRERICPHCGFSLEVYDQLHRTVLTQSCPRCGSPLA